MTPCIGCLLGCVPYMFRGEPITCALNPECGREAEIVPADKHKKSSSSAAAPAVSMLPASAHSAAIRSPFSNEAMNWAATSA